MSVRTNCLARLAVILNTDSVNTVVRAEESLDLDTYTASQIPLVEIIALEEIPFYETARYAKWTCKIITKVYYLDSKGTDSQKEILLKEQKDALGGDPTLNDECAMVDIVTILSGGVFPLYTLEFTLEVTYEKHIASG